jgi:hypothetical protein
MCHTLHPHADAKGQRTQHPQTTSTKVMCQSYRCQGIDMTRRSPPQVSRPARVEAGEAGATLVVCAGDEAALDAVLAALPPPPPLDDHSHERSSSEHACVKAQRQRSRSRGIPARRAMRVGWPKTLPCGFCLWLLRAIQQHPGLTGSVALRRSTSLAPWLTRTASSPCSGPRRQEVGQRAVGWRVRHRGRQHRPGGGAAGGGAPLRVGPHARADGRPAAQVRRFAALTLHHALLVSPSSFAQLSCCLVSDPMRALPRRCRPSEPFLLPRVSLQTGLFPGLPGYVCICWCTTFRPHNFGAPWPKGTLADQINFGF